MPAMWYSRRTGPTVPFTTSATTRAIAPVVSAPGAAAAGAAAPGVHSGKSATAARMACRTGSPARRPGTSGWGDEGDGAERRVIVVVTLVEAYAPGFVHHERGAGRSVQTGRRV